MNYYTKNPENKTKSAIALRYDKSKDDAPRILATGREILAEKIIEIAAQEGIEIHEDKDLADILSFVEIGSYIPIEAYGAVAKILNHIYKYKENQDE